MELKHYLVILRRWGWIMLLCTILASVASYWFSSRQPRVYESIARYLVGPVLDNPNVSSNDMRASSQVGQTYAQIVTTRPIVQGVIDKLKLDNVTDAETVAKNVTATWIDAAQILSIRVHASDPQVAADIANALGEALIERSPGGPTSLQAAKRQDALNFYVPSAAHGTGRCDPADVYFTLRRAHRTSSRRAVTVSPPGSRSPASSSASGTSTNARSRSPGWGITRSGSATSTWS